MTKLFKKSISIIIVLCFAIYPQSVMALPQGGSINGGSASTVGNDMNITCADRCVGTWDSFSIGEIESVNFAQPATTSIALNKVTGGNPSNILGALTATGKVFLINPSGILFGVNATVDTAGLVASTLSLDMDDSTFLGGSNDFSFTGPGGSVTNYGLLTTMSRAGGYVALLGSSVKNFGTISTHLGKTVLAAGEAMTLDLDPAGHISVVVDITTGTERNDDGDYAAVNNAGTIEADEGQVILTAEILGTVFTNAVNNDGIIEAGSMEEAPGEVLLVSNQDIELNGTIVAGTAIEAYADGNIIIGKDVDPLQLVEYDWEYLSGSRMYDFTEFGYYYNDGAMLVPLSVGDDIGKDGLSPEDGTGYATIPQDPQGIYAKFDTGSGILTYFQDADLNPDVPDGLDHLEITDTVYAWEDQLNNGDQDFNDAVIDFDTSSQELQPASALLDAEDIFLTALYGYIRQDSGEISAHNLAMSSDDGVTGIGSNGGIEVDVDNVSAINRTSGDIRISDISGDLVVSSHPATLDVLRYEGTCGIAGVTNCAVGGEVDIEALGEGEDLVVDAPIHSYGEVNLYAAHDILQNNDGDITVHNAYQAPGVPTNLTSPSHVVGEYSEDRTVDVTWQLPENPDGLYGLTATADHEYVMDQDAEIKTQGGDVTITAAENVEISSIDAQNGNVEVTSTNGDVIDVDGGSEPDDIIAHNIQITVEGTVDDTLDPGHPYDFSYLWNNASVGDPDLIANAYTESFDKETTGDWTFGTTSNELADGSWWFHVSTLDNPVPDSSPCADGTCPGQAEERAFQTALLAYDEVSIDEPTCPTQISDPADIGPFLFRTDVPPPPPPDDDTFFQALTENRVYYEILEPSQYLVYEPAQPIGLYAYHPLSSADLSAFDGIQLDAGAYDFISDNIEMKKKANPYYGLQ